MSLLRKVNPISSGVQGRQWLFVDKPPCTGLADYPVIFTSFCYLFVMVVHIDNTVDFVSCNLFQEAFVLSIYSVVEIMTWE